MEISVKATIADLTQAKDQMIRALNNVPQDKVDWSPAPSARSAIHIVAHSANSLGHISLTLLGTPYPAPTMAQADQEFLEAEKSVTTREAALELLEANFQKYVDVMQSLKSEDPNKMIPLPFGLGAAPLHFMVGMGALHTRTHTAQIEYLQTIYGDRTW
jgi:hypothetical protein